MTGVAVLLVLFALLGAPLFAVIARARLPGSPRAAVDLAVVPIEFYRMADTPVLLGAARCSRFAGYLLGESTRPQRLVRLTEAFLGWLPGGLAIVTVASCALFTAFTGASGVTIVALGALLYPALRHAGYGERFSLGLLTSAGSLGVLFAPSLPLILYGVIVAAARGRAAGVDRRAVRGRPAARAADGRACSPAGASGATGRSARAPARSRGPRRARRCASRRGSCRCRSSCSAGSTAAASRCPRRPPSPWSTCSPWRCSCSARSRSAACPTSCAESMVLVGAVLVILGMSLASTNYLIDAEVPAKLFAAVRAHITSPLTFLLLLNVFLLVLGMMLDIFSAIVIVVPLILPIAVGYGIDPGAPRHHLPRQHADRLLHAAGGHEPLHREPPLRQAGAGARPRGRCRSSSSCSPPC